MERSLQKKEKACFKLINMYNPKSSKSKCLSNSEWINESYLYLNIKESFNLKDFSKIYKILQKLPLKDRLQVLW